MEEMLRIANGDEQAFSGLFHRYRDKVYSVAFKLTGSSFIAAEVVQEVFTKVWTRRETLPGISDFESYLFIMARNCVLTSLRRTARQQSTESDWNLMVNTTEKSAESRLIADEYTDLLREAVDALPFHQRQVYLLSQEEEMTRSQIAELLQISPETVKSHLARASRSVRAFCASRLGITLALLLIFLSPGLKSGVTILADATHLASIDYQSGAVGPVNPGHDFFKPLKKYQFAAPDVRFCESL